MLELSSSLLVQLKSQSGLSQESESPNPHVVPIQELESQPPSQNSESLTKVNEIRRPTRPLQVYSTRKAHILDLLQAHEFEPALEKEVTPISDPTSENSFPLLNSFYYDLPISIRKGTRECTKHPLYPFLTLPLKIHFHFLIVLTMICPLPLGKVLENAPSIHYTHY